MYSAVILNDFFVNLPWMELFSLHEDDMPSPQKLPLKHGKDKSVYRQKYLYKQMECFRTNPTLSVVNTLYLFIVAVY